MKIIKGWSAEQELESLRRVLIAIIEPSADEWTK